MSKALYAFIGLTIAASIVAPASAAINYTSSRSNTGNLCARPQSTPHPSPTRRPQKDDEHNWIGMRYTRSNTGGNNGIFTGNKNNAGNSCAAPQSALHPTHTRPPVNAIDYTSSRSNTGNINAKAHPTHTTGPINAINYNTSKSNTGNSTFTGSRSNQTQNSRKAATKATPGSKPAQDDWQTPPTR